MSIIWETFRIFALKYQLKMSPVFRHESEYVFKIFSNEEERMHIKKIVEKICRQL